MLKVVVFTDETGKQKVGEFYLPADVTDEWLVKNAVPVLRTALILTRDWNDRRSEVD